VGLKGVVKGLADDAYLALASGLPRSSSSHCMTGAIMVASADKKTVHFKQTANYNGSPEDAQAYHVENALMAALFTWTQTVLKTPFVLPANSIVYIYVYYSPCKLCTQNLAPFKSMKQTWIPRNPTVKWKLAWSAYFVGRTNGYDDSSKADTAYGAYLGHFHSIRQI
jgi:hypothetical protein